MNELLTCVLILLTTLSGYSLLSIFNLARKIDGIVACMSFGVGFGLISFIMFMYSVIGVEWSRVTILAPLGLLIGLNYLKNKTSISISWDKQIVASTFFFPLIILLSFFVVFESFIRPLIAWDAWSSWQVRAKVYYVDEKITASSFSYLETDYPLVVPLYSVFIYEMLEEVDDTAVQFVSASFYLFIGLLAYSLVKQNTNRNFALVSTFLVLSTQNLIRHGGRFEAGMADIVMAFFILISLTCFHFIISRKDYSKVIPLILFATIASHVKNEGIVFAIVILSFLLCILIKRKLFRSIWYMFFFILPLVGWQILKEQYQVPRGILSLSPQISLIVLVNLVLTQLYQYINFINWNLGWVFVFLGILSAVLRKNFPLTLVIILLQSCAYLFVFFFSTVDPVWHARGISDRLLLQIFPSAVAFTFVFIFPYIRKSGILQKMQII